MLSMRTRLAALLAAPAVLLAGPASAGIQAQPMAYDLAPSGAAARQDLRVENTGDQPSPVEVRVERREILPDGQEKRTAADDDFLVFPPQAVLPANGFQTFRVQYVGDPALAATKLYLVTVAQLPVKGAEQKSGVEFLFHLGTLAAVSPPSAKAKIVVAGVKPAADPGKLEITVRNEGNRYARLRNGAWTITGGDGRAEVLDGEKLFAAIEQPLIEPGTTRVITLPVDAGLRREGARAEFKLADAAQ